MLDMALTSVRFFRNEELCGKCSPCRIGTQKLVDLLESCGRAARRLDKGDHGDAEGPVGRCCG